MCMAQADYLQLIGTIWTLPLGRPLMATLNKAIPHYPERGISQADAIAGTAGKIPSYVLCTNREHKNPRLPSVTLGGMQQAVWSCWRLAAQSLWWLTKGSNRWMQWIFPGSTWIKKKTKKSAQMTDLLTRLRVPGNPGHHVHARKVKIPFPSEG